MTLLENHSTGLMYPAMTYGQRVVASTNTGNLHWAVYGFTASKNFAGPPTGKFKDKAD
jgi:hypothetical protein